MAAVSRNKDTARTLMCVGVYTAKERQRAGERGEAGKKRWYAGCLTIGGDRSVIGRRALVLLALSPSC